MFTKKICSFLLSVTLISTISVTPVMAKTQTEGEGLKKVTEQKFDIGDVSLNAKIMGNKGNVSVVFDAGYGDGLYTYSMEDPNVETWGSVQPEISKYAKTVAYDRAGLGKSDVGTNRTSLSDEDIQKALNGETLPYDASIFNTGRGKTALDRARDLHALLEKAKVRAPYILVVHSISMLEAVEFTKEYPTEVAGIVSVDGSWNSVVEDVVGWARVDLPDLVGPFLAQFTPADGSLSEVLQSEMQVRHAGDVLRNIPFTILHPEDEGNGPVYQEMTNQKMNQWLTWSDHSKLIMVPNTGHYVMNDNPQYVVDAVKDMIATVEGKDLK